MTVRIDEIVAHASRAAFGKRRVMNVHRAILVEAIVDKALRDKGWSWCSGDYASHDFHHTDGTRLEAKQSAALQSWKTARPSPAIFDIAPRTGYFENGVEWVEAFGRHTDIYLFARHPVADEALADHRDPYQWDFHLLRASRIVAPRQKTMSLGSIRSLNALTRGFDALGETVEAMRLGSI
jgi:hypothetical protein